MRRGGGAPPPPRARKQWLSFLFWSVANEVKLSSKAGHNLGREMSFPLRAAASLSPPPFPSTPSSSSLYSFSAISNQYTRCKLEGDGGGGVRSAELVNSPVSR